MSAIKTLDERIEDFGHASVTIHEQLEMSRAEVSELRAKVESLNRSNLELTRCHDEQKLQEKRLETALQRERSKVESLAADAERYTAWRDGLLADDESFMDTVYQGLRKIVPEWREPVAHEWDTAIDMAKEKAQ